MNLRLVANVIRGLAMDGVQRANSGHPGMPMGTADFAAVLFLKFLRHNPANPAWDNRDRYVQSAGHGSMLLYSLLHLCGYGLTLDDLMNFRQLGSRTPGHPEHGLAPGVETTTGPLGQGCGNAVGMAMAEAMLAAKFNREGFPVVDHRTFVIASDGDLMEGVSHEAFSLAGHLGLNKLIVFFDSNRITIEGSTALACSDDARRRFEGYRWSVLDVDGHDHAAIEQALRVAVAEPERPTLLIGHTHIAMGSPRLQDSQESHGAPLGEDEVAAAKTALGLPPDRTFYVPDEVRSIFAQRAAEWAREEETWRKLFAGYRQSFPDLAREYGLHHERKRLPDLGGCIPSFDPARPLATRAASGAVLQKLARALPQLVGGSADLAPSTNTLLKEYPSVGSRSFGGRNLHFGIREHAMGSVLNGMTLHGGWIVYGATFLVFSDYFKPAIRLAAIMELPVILVFTHDSIFLGEDGPTHQPVEQLAGLRAIPKLSLLRPADAAETAEAWLAALSNTRGPTALVLSRQAVPVLDRSRLGPASGLRKGAYTLWQSGAGVPDLILLASGSEVSVALAAAEDLAGSGANVRVVSMPSWDLFDQQPARYRKEVLPPRCKRRLVVEAGSPMGWEKYIGPRGCRITQDGFGASAPAQALARHFGFTPERVAGEARKMLKSKAPRAGHAS